MPASQPANQPALEAAAPAPVRRLRRAERREQILAAATRAFARAGFAATSLDDIAAQAGVSRAILYRHFDSKTDLYRAVLDRACTRLADAVGTSDFTAASPTASRPPNGSVRPWTASSRRPSRLPDDRAQPPAGGAERLLNLLVRGSFGEQEAQVAVTLRERTDVLAYRDGDRQAGDTRDGRGVGPAVHGSKYARAFHGQHQHASGSDQALGRHAAAQGVGEHQLFEARAV